MTTRAPGRSSTPAPARPRLVGRLADGLARRLAARPRPFRRIPLPDPPVKVNLGSGLEVAEGWIHVDGNIHTLFAGWPPLVVRLLYRSAGTARRLVTEDEYVRLLRAHRFVHHDLERPLPFADDSVDFVYSSHVLEHFHREVAARLLAEVRRVLRPRGYVRICVPDLEHAVALYEAGDKEAALGYFFAPEGAGHFFPHRYMYDFALVRTALETAGLREVRRCGYREGRVPDLERLDNRPEETLYVEAAK